MLHAHVTATTAEPYERNTVLATRRVLDRALEVGVGNVIHVSSMIVRSKVEDHYARTKKVQEEMVLSSGLRVCVLRPTLMYGWFDPKHLGWLARFMGRVPVFPIPGSGRFIRQPLYSMDLGRVIERCIDDFPEGQTYEIVGAERIEYVELLKAIRAAKGHPAAVRPPADPGVPGDAQDIRAGEWLAAVHGRPADRADRRRRVRGRGHRGDLRGDADALCGGHPRDADGSSVQRHGPQ